jgi:hypothetical protein
LTGVCRIATIGLWHAPNYAPALTGPASRLVKIQGPFCRLGIWAWPVGRFGYLGGSALSPESSTDWWIRFCVRIVCGALLGVLLGLSLWLTLANSSAHLWLLIPACALVMGLAAALWGDAFWHSLRHWLWWWP